MSSEAFIMADVPTRRDWQPVRSDAAGGARGQESFLSSGAARPSVWLVTSDQPLMATVTSALKAQGMNTIVLHELRELAAHLAADGQASIVVDLDPHPRLVLGELERLTAQYPAARVIALARAVASDLLMDAMQAGVRRVMTKDVVSQELAAVVHRLSPAVTPTRSAAGKIITVLSASGGCGATTVAANLAAELGGGSANQPALLIDLDCNYGAISTLFGLAPRYAVDHLLHYENMADTDLLRSTTTVRDPQVHVLASPASLRPPRTQPIDFSHLGDILALASRAYANTIIDAPRLPGYVTAELVSASTNVLLLFQLTVKDLRFARSMIDTLRDHAVPMHHVTPVANRHVKRPPISLDDARKVLEGLEIRTLRNDFTAAVEGVNFGKTLAEVAPRSPLRRDLQDLLAAWVPA